MLTHIERGKAGRSESCPKCGRDLHVCLNCKFYEPSAHNQCREPQAERVLEKDRSNFCDFFTFTENRKAGDGRKVDEQLKKLDDLFK
ncbi:MAG: hypothetical protein J5J00_12855 [Deltaproteobacteria bacterium]|nr:hypothetical protein [Deltaproteobacteria bacterium]